MQPVELSIVIPVWGNEHNLHRLIPSIVESLESLGVSFEILVSAGPGNAALASLENELGYTFVETGGGGYGDILREGLRRACGSYVVTMDSDFSHRPGYVRTMWYHRDAGEVLIASRYVRGAFTEVSWGRRILSRLLNFLYRKGLALPYRDLSSGFRMFRREVLEDIGLPEGKDLDALPEMIAKASGQGWKVVEVPFWYQAQKPWSRARVQRLGIGYLRTLGKTAALRNSVRAADYDHRAFDSWIPLQRYWQRERFRIIQDFVGDAGWVLDIGCGSSRIVQTLPRVVGMDVAIRKLRWLRAPGRYLLQGDLSRLPFKDGTFDSVICSEVIEHVPRARVDLAEFVRVIRGGGTLILGTPDYGRWRWRALERLYAKVFPGGYVLEHINPYTHRELRSQLERLNLEVVDCRYVGGAEMIFKAVVPAATTPTLRPVRSAS